MTQSTHDQNTNCELCQKSQGSCIDVPHYRVRICTNCELENRAGWRKEHEALLFQGLGRSGLLIPDRTQEGLLPYNYQPPSDYAL